MATKLKFYHAQNIGELPIGCFVDDIDAEIYKRIGLSYDFMKKLLTDMFTWSDFYVYCTIDDSAKPFISALGVIRYTKTCMSVEHEHTYINEESIFIQQDRHIWLEALYSTNHFGGIIMKALLSHYVDKNVYLKCERDELFYYQYGFRDLGYACGDEYMEFSNYRDYTLCIDQQKIMCLVRDINHPEITSLCVDIFDYCDEKIPFIANLVYEYYSSTGNTKLVILEKITQALAKLKSAELERTELKKANLRKTNLKMADIKSYQCAKYLFQHYHELCDIYL